MAEITKTDDKMSITQTSKRILQMMCQRFKSTDPEIDRKIDAAAPFIMGHAWVKFLPGLRTGEPIVPPYLEGSDGVGRVAIVEAAARDLCRCTGLNFVKNPPIEYTPTKDDICFFEVSSSAYNKNNGIYEQRARAAIPENAKHAWASIVIFDEIDKANPTLRLDILNFAVYKENRILTEIGQHTFVVIGGNDDEQNESLSFRTVSEVTRVELIRV